MNQFCPDDEEFLAQVSGGLDVTLGLAFTKTGALYPFFAAMLGWLGVALTGSDTSSNALFGNLQRITAERLDLNPILICASNSTGGVMGKMIDAQRIVVASAATASTTAKVKSYDSSSGTSSSWQAWSVLLR